MRCDLGLGDVGGGVNHVVEEAVHIKARVRVHLERTTRDVGRNMRTSSKLSKARVTYKADLRGFVECVKR